LLGFERLCKDDSMHLLYIFMYLVHSP
jgi:hypothetical protein